MATIDRDETIWRPRIAGPRRDALAPGISEVWGRCLRGSMASCLTGFYVAALCLAAIGYAQFIEEPSTSMAVTLLKG